MNSIRRTYVLIAAIIGSMFGIAAAQTPPVPIPINLSAFSALLTPELWAVIVFSFSGRITTSLTTYFKRWFKTEGDASKRLNFLVTTVLTGLLPFLTGLYGYTFQGFAYAVLVSVVRAITDQGGYARDVQVQAKANKIAPAVVVPQPNTASEPVFVDPNVT